jgi:hypothetical protein
MWDVHPHSPYTPTNYYPVDTYRWGFPQSNYNHFYAFPGNFPMMNSRSSPRERLTSSGSVLSDDSEMLDGIEDAVFDVHDPRLLKAVDKAGKEKNILPLIKEELRLSILSRRNKEGKGEVIVEERKPQVKRASGFIV